MIQAKGNHVPARTAHFSADQKQDQRIAVAAFVIQNFPEDSNPADDDVQEDSHD